MKTNPSTPSPEHAQSQEPIFPDRSCKTCAHGKVVSFPVFRESWHSRAYCALTGGLLQTTAVGCSYWKGRPTHGH